MNKITNFNIKVVSILIFIGLIVATHNLIIPKNIFYLFLKLIFLIPSVALIVNIANIIPKHTLLFFSKVFGAIVLITLIIISYLSSKRKPDNFSDLFDKWDSFAHVKIILDIEKVLKKSVSAGKIGNVNSIKSILNLIS